MGAEIIAFKPKGSAVEDVTADSIMLALAADRDPGDLRRRYERALPLAREFVDSWIDDPEALADFLAWAHARGALKF